jgi:hypothetical protein
MLLRNIKIWVIAIMALVALLVTGCGTNTPISQTQASNLAIKTTSLTDGQIGIGYFKKLEASGGSGRYTWSITSGSLPDGLELNSNTGIISGNPKQPGSADFTIQVNDGAKNVTQSFSLTIKSAAANIVVSKPTLGSGEIGINYSQKLEASGGNGTYTWSISGGSLPEGLVLDSSTGIISGVPKVAGGTSFSVQANDGNSSATQGYSIQIKDSPVITTTSLPNGNVDTFYDEIASASGGSINYVWSISEGALPDGLSVDAQYGEVYGTPTKEGTSDFTIKVTDDMGGSVTKKMSITIGPPLPPATP